MYLAERTFFVADTRVKSLAMPDFVYSTTNKGFMQRVRDCILPFECKNITGALALQS